MLLPKTSGSLRRTHYSLWFSARALDFVLVQATVSQLRSLQAVPGGDA